MLDITEWRVKFIKSSLFVKCEIFDRVVSYTVISVFHRALSSHPVVDMLHFLFILLRQLEHTCVWFRLSALVSAPLQKGSRNDAFRCCWKLNRSVSTGGDQGVLNSFFNSWATTDISKHLPFIYNLSTVSIYSYLPAFKQSVHTCMFQ